MVRSAILPHPRSHAKTFDRDCTADPDSGMAAESGFANIIQMQVAG